MIIGVIMHYIVDNWINEHVRREQALFNFNPRFNYIAYDKYFGHRLGSWAVAFILYVLELYLIIFKNIQFF